MRFLSKIAFINSAAIRFAEVNLDGNVHFIGTQGVGKSTVLRAVLFFYNADTQKLGIAKEKRLFSEYYFPYANSYIVYEVARETGPFCVLLFKSLGRLAFRFVDGPFDRRNFIAEDGRVADAWDKIRSSFDQQGTDYSRKIETFEEYRDIIYGNNEGKRDLRKYALLESRQYQSIARTIQNVFLNSRLEAEFIKQTIIHSLSDVDVQIDLQTYQYELKGFEEQLADIRQFKQSIAQANTVSALSGSIQSLEQEKADLCRHLGRAVDQAQKKKPELESAVREAEGKKGRIVKKVEEAEQRSAARKTTIREKITLLRNHLETANKMVRHYQEINIEEIIRRVSRKEELKSDKVNLEREQGTLTAHFQDITSKFETLERLIDNELAEFGNSIERRRNEIEAKFLAIKEQLRDAGEKLLAEIERQHEIGLRDAETAYKLQTSAVQKLRERKAGLANKRFYEAETEQARHLITELKASLIKIESSLQVLTGEAETRRKQWEYEQKSLTDSHERQKSKFDERISQLSEQLCTIESTLRTGKDSFYGWLSDHYPEWETSIGKVCDEKILFHPDLSPRLNPDGRAFFYGVELDLKEIDRKVKTLSDYEKERDGISSEIQAVRVLISELSAGYNGDIEKLNKRHNSKIREIQGQQRLAEYNAQQTTDKLRAAELNLADLQKRADEEKKAALELIGSEIATAEKDESKAKEAVESLKEEIKKQRAAIEKDRNRKIEAESGRKGQTLAGLEHELRQYRKEREARRSDLAKQKQTELSGKGADVTRLREIERKLTDVGTELDYIESNQENVYNYSRDKKEFIDRTEEFKQQRQVHEQVLTQEEQKYQRIKAALDGKVKSLDEEIGKYKGELGYLQEDLEAFQAFKQWPWFDKVSELLKEEPSRPTNERCKDVIDRLKEIHYSINDRLKELREATNKYLGRFSAENIFQFKTNLVTDGEYLQFAFELSIFISEDKITQYEKRVNERYAHIIKLIARETDAISSREGEIQSVIGKINRDITEKNFVGVIQKIELKMDDSANRVVQILKMIAKFHEEEGLVLGSANLFSWQNDQDSTNKKAVDLLKQLVKELAEYKHDAISLSDTFELKFRVIENQNDTGWVERLSNVGSEGTDILVKAMLNIMLLNVFKEGASRKFKDFKLHCVMDEIGRLHPANVRGILKFANDRNILLINGSPTETDALAYRHIYKLEKDADSFTKVKRIITQH